MILLSILIPSIPSRIEKLNSLVSRIETQSDHRLEMLVLMDNKTRSLGEKRNALIREAHGKFIANIDDDDLISENYFALLVPLLAEDVDLVAYDATCSLNGAPPFRVNTGLHFDNEQPKHLPGGRYSDIRRTPWHWCAWRKELAMQCRFPEYHDGAEDAYFLRQALPKVRTWRKLDEAIFHHRYDANSSTFTQP